MATVFNVTVFPISDQTINGVRKIVVLPVIGGIERGRFAVYPQPGDNLTAIKALIQAALQTMLNAQVAAPPPPNGGVSYNVTITTP